MTEKLLNWDVKLQLKQINKPTNIERIRNVSSCRISDFSCVSLSSVCLQQI